MWLGTEDGCIHIYPCGENIRLKKNRTRIQQGAAVLCIVYVYILYRIYSWFISYQEQLHYIFYRHVDNCVFASLANGDVMIYRRMPSNYRRTKSI